MTILFSFPASRSARNRPESASAILGWSRSTPASMFRSCAASRDYGDGAGASEEAASATAISTASADA